VDIQDQLNEIFSFRFPKHQFEIKKGKLVKLYLDGRVIKQLSSFPEQLYMYKTLQVLYIQNQPSMFTSNIDFQKFTKLRKLSIAGSGLTEIPLPILNILPKLKILYIGDVRELNFIHGSLTTHEMSKKIKNYINDIPIEKSRSYWNFKTNWQESFQKVDNLADLRNLYFQHRDLLKYYPVLVAVSLLIITSISIFISVIFKDLRSIAVLFLIIVLVIGIVFITDTRNELFTFFKKLWKFVYLIRYPFPRSGSVMSTDYINKVLLWANSSDAYKKLYSINYMRFLVARNDYIDDQMEKLQLNEGEMMILGTLKQFYQEIKNLPLIKVEKQQKEKVQHKETQTKDTSNVKEQVFRNLEDIIELRDCCRMNGRFGDKYCNLCGRVIPDELIFNTNRENSNDKN
jgi:hypothetical protein